MSYILELEHIRKSFLGVTALSDMSLKVRRGEVHAIVGENGAGKSTLIKVIAGAHQPDSGEIKLNGKPVRFTSAAKSLEQGISVIYQETSLFPDLSVVENLFVGSYPRKSPLGSVDYEWMEQQAAAIFEQFGLHIDIHANVGSLSIAMKQIVEIAKAMWRESDVVIMDEPTASLSEKEVETLFEVVETMKKRGATILYISHRLEELFRIADTVTVIRDGSYVLSKPLADTTKDELVSLMVGRSLTQLYPERTGEPGDVILEVRNLRRAGEAESVSFSLRRGEVLGFAGIAGAGRTEMAQALAGLAPKSGGEVAVCGRERVIRSYRDAMDAGIAYVSEDRARYGLVLPMSIRENITLKILGRISRYRFIDKKKDRQIAVDYLNKLRIRAPDEQFPVQNLSGGNQQKVSVAKSLACDPSVLILDEPTRGVDVGAKSEIHRIISDRAQEGLAIILISSDMPELLGMCDRILVMRDGALSGEFDGAEATQEKILTAALNA